MKKRWEVFWLAEAGIILIYILLCLVEPVLLHGSLHPE